MKNALRILVDAPSAVAELAAAVLISGVTVDVVWRFATGGSVPALFSIVTLYCMPAIFFLPLGKVQALNAHITVEIVEAQLSEKLRRVVGVISAAVSVAILSLLFLSSGREALSKYRSGLFEVDGNIVISTWPPRFFLPIGVGVAIVVLLWTLSRRQGEDKTYD